MSYIARLTGSRPLALIEVGASAGLNLIWDRYAYDYGAGKHLGNPDAPVRITTELKGNHRRPLPDRPPAVVHRVGVDLHVPDLANPTEALWLRSLIWPDQPERMDLLIAAMEDSCQQSGYSPIHRNSGCSNGREERAEANIWQTWTITLSGRTIIVICGARSSNFRPRHTSGCWRQIREQEVTGAY